MLDEHLATALNRLIGAEKGEARAASNARPPGGNGGHAQHAIAYDR